MLNEFAEAEINRQLDSTIVELELARAENRVNIFEAMSAGAIANLLCRQDIIGRLEAVIAGLTLADTLRGAITNIDPREVDPTRALKLPSPQQAARRYPLCDDDSLVQRMKTKGDPHVQLCLEGDLDRATKAAMSELAMEDIGCTLAAIGHFDRAIAFIDAQRVQDSVRAQVRFIILLERCRRKSPGFIESLNKASLSVNGRLNAILALTGRLPWGGYPYSDW